MQGDWQLYLRLRRGLPGELGQEPRGPAGHCIAAAAAPRLGRTPREASGKQPASRWTINKGGSRGRPLAAHAHTQRGQIGVCLRPSWEQRAQAPARRPCPGPTRPSSPGCAVTGAAELPAGAGTLRAARQIRNP